MSAERIYTSDDVHECLSALERSARADYTHVSAGYGIMVSITRNGRVTYRLTGSASGKQIAWADAYRSVASALGVKPN